MIHPKRLHLSDAFHIALVSFLLNLSPFSERICNVRWENIPKQQVIHFIRMSLGLVLFVVSERLRKHVSSNGPLEL